MMISDGRSGGGGTSGGGSPYHHHHHHQHQYQQAYQQHKHHHIHHLHHPPPPSPPSSPSSAASTTRCCSLKRSSCCRRRGRASWCCCCYCPASSVFTSLGVCILVLGYTLLGAFVFMALEGGSMRDPTSQLAAATTSSKSSVLGEDIRSRTVEKLWSITEDLNILYKDNWTRLAAQEVLKFQDTLVRNLRGYGGGGVVVKGGASSGAGNGAAIYYSHHHHRWSFSSSFLYSLTLITTIGYGSVAPRTALGKVITIVYALIGIPLMLVYLSTIGDVLARNFRRLYGRLCGSSSTKNSSSGLGKSGKMGPGVSSSSTAAISSSAESYLSGYAASTKSHNSISADGSAIKLYPDHHPPGEDKLVVLDCGGDGIGSGADPGGGGKQQQQQHHRQHCEASPSPVRVPISLCLLIILLYICGGALLFNRLENWTFLEGSYFCFTSLGTIGFGDLIPGLYHQAGEQLSVFASSAYILVGMALIAMCFNLVQDQVVIGVRRMGRYFGVTGRAVGGDGDDEDMMMDVVDGEGIAMSVVSSSATSS